MTDDSDSLKSAESLAQHLMIGLTANMQVMAQTVGVMAEQMKALGYKVKEESTRNLWRWVTLLIVAGVGAILIVQNREAIDILTNATNPAAQARQAEATQQIVTQIDCHDEENHIELLTNLAETFPQLDIPELSPKCQTFFEENPDQRSPETSSPTSTP